MDESRLNVLLAEDDYLVCDAVSAAITASGYRVCGTARDGKEAVALTVSEKPDVVLMDIQMPGMGGLEAARQIQDRCPTPVVILTAYESRELVAEATEAGVAAYLTKPPRADEIQRAVAIAVARHEDMCALRRMNAALEKERRVVMEVRDKLAIRNGELRKALNEIKTLRGILPVCCYCKKVRNDEGYWEQVDAYIHKHTLAEISHGVCPGCLENEFPDYSAR